MPCGTPEETFTEVEQVLFRTTFCKRFAKNSLIHLCTFPYTPYQWSLYTSVSGLEWCQMVLQSPLRLSQFVCLYHSCSFGTIPVLIKGAVKNYTLRIRAIELSVHFF